MRKTVAILFLSILLFNWIGYRLVTGFIESEHTRQFTAQLAGENYDESELISVKTPYPLPYLTNSQDFEKWNGEVNIEGVLYKYVKRRFINDSIEFLCVPDYKSMQIQTARENFFWLANDLLQNQPDKKSNQQQVPAFKSMLNDYCDEIKSFDFSFDGQSISYYSFYSSSYTGYFGNTTEQPPDIS